MNSPLQLSHLAKSVLLILYFFSPSISYILFDLGKKIKILCQAFPDRFFFFSAREALPITSGRAASGETCGFLAAHAHAAVAAAAAAAAAVRGC